jgi:hypothetical protein
MFGVGLGASEAFWQLVETVEGLRSQGRTTDAIASLLRRSPAQVEGVEILARKLREELERLVRS